MKMQTGRSRKSHLIAFKRRCPIALINDQAANRSVLRPSFLAT